MANYDGSAEIGSTIDSALAAGTISAATADAIKGLLTELGANTSAQNVTASDLASTDGVLTNAQLGSDPIVIMGADTSADLTLTAASDVQAIVVGGKGDSVINASADTKDLTIQLSGGENDSVSTGQGSDTVTFDGGSATVDTGEGNDAIVLGKNAGAVTIDAGDGFDQVVSQTSRGSHTFTGVNGKFTMHSDVAATMENVNIVSFDEDGNGTIDAITVLADTAGDAITAKLYQVAFGREGLDDAAGTNGLDGADAVRGELGGIAYWTTVFDQGTNTGADLQNTVYSFLNSDEFHSQYDSMSDLQYVQALFANLNEVAKTAVTTVNGMTAEDFAAQIGGNTQARYDVAWTIASSDQAVQILGANGDNYVIEGFSGDDGPAA